MPRVQVIHNKDYTVMSNYHFREKNMSLKAKGLLSMMLSLPDTWNYTIEGLVELSDDGSKSVRAGLRELEEFGYLVRSKRKSEKGLYTGIDYLCYEVPQGREVNAPILGIYSKIEKQERDIADTEGDKIYGFIDFLQKINTTEENQKKILDICDIIKRIHESKAKNLQINGGIISKKEFLFTLESCTKEQIEKVLMCDYPSSNPYTYWTTILYNSIKYNVTKPKSKGNSFCMENQNHYDFKELEKKLLSN